MKLYLTQAGPVVERDDSYYTLAQSWDALLNIDDLPKFLESEIHELKAVELMAEFLAPIGSQEVWAAGVTYFRSRTARMEESKSAGGGDFYDRVYAADRPELFMKATPHRVRGHRQDVRIRSDASWNVPEPELTLVITSSG